MSDLPPDPEQKSAPVAPPTRPPPLRPRWHWFILFLPTVEILTVCTFAARLGHWFEITGPVPGYPIVQMNFFVFWGLCYALSRWWRRTSQKNIWSDRERSHVLVMILILNCGVAYAGCAVLAPPLR